MNNLFSLKKFLLTFSQLFIKIFLGNVKVRRDLMHYFNMYYRKALFLLILYLFIAGGMAGCTFKTVKPEFVIAPPQKYSIGYLGRKPLKKFSILPLRVCQSLQ
jgi:hypothetical protein